MQCDRRAYKLTEKRLRPSWTALEFRVGLRGDKPRVNVARKLHHLDQALVRRDAGDHQTGVLKASAKRVVELVAMTMALVDQLATASRASVPSANLHG